MSCFRRRLPFVFVLVAAGAVVIAAALTSWWVLLALIPLAMMTGCAAMMAAHARVPDGARCGCCLVSAAPASNEGSVREGANAPLAS